MPVRGALVVSLLLAAGGCGVRSKGRAGSPPADLVVKLDEDGRVSVGGEAIANMEPTPLEKSLAWLAWHQEPDGRWDAKKHGGIDADPAATGLALVAFLWSGHTEDYGGEHEGLVRRAVRWIISQQDADGAIGQGSEGGLGRNHAICGWALAEAYAESGVPETGEAAQRAVEFSCKVHQAEGGGWGDEPKGTESLAVTRWFILQLKSAAAAQLEVPTSSFTGAVNFFSRATTTEGPLVGRFSDKPGYPASPEMTVAGISCFLDLGWKCDDPLLVAGMDYVMSQAGNRPQESVGFEYLFFGTLTMYRMGTQRWKAWGNARDLAYTKTDPIQVPI